MGRSVVAAAVSTAVVAAALTLTGSTAPQSTPELAASTPNPITPGNFTGYGFDQCEAPSQSKMTAWLEHSPFRAAGIYISGSLRYCQKQTYLTPEWVRTQLTTGWRLLPIHLGAQASCSTRDRYQRNKIDPSSTNDYGAARTQGREEAKIAVAAAKNLGIVAKSTLYYDLEAFSIKNTSCRISSLKFLSAWTKQVRTLGYVSGIYSSAASGMKILDDARVEPGSTITMPDQIWIADWNDKADTKSTYIRADGWAGKRIHQYQGGHNETWGGVKINIDRNYLDLRGNAYTPKPVTTPEGSKLVDPKCTTSAISRPAYRLTKPGAGPGLMVPLQCLLKRHGQYAGPINGKWNSRVDAAVNGWQRRVDHRTQRAFTRSDWVSILATGTKKTVLKPGVRGADVIRAQRALNAATNASLKVSGVYDEPTRKAAAAYQKTNGISPTEGTIANLTWGALTAGRW